MKKIAKKNIILVLLFALFIVQSAIAKEIETIPPKRVVSLAPSITDTLVALGYGENIVAISSYCTMHKSINKEVKRVGVGNAYNAEHILALKPDLVLGLEKNTLADISFHTIRTLSFSDVMLSYIQIAELMGDKARGENLYNETQKKIIEIQKSFQSKAKPRILIVLGREKSNNGLIYQITAAGSDLYFNDLLNTLNASNALHTKEAYPILNFEQIQLANPDIIIDLVYPEKKELLTLDDWTNMPLKAVQNNRILISHIGMVPGPKSLLFLDEIMSIR